VNGEAIVTVSAAVVALTQLVKWAGIPDRFGPLIVMLLGVIGVAVWTWSQAIPPEDLRGAAFGLFAGWIAVATSAAGVFGFTRAAAGAVTSMTPPPSSGAGSERTVSH
jgi:hypothetical protein